MAEKSIREENDGYEPVGERAALIEAYWRAAATGCEGVSGGAV
jgi:hypothetical protein